MIKRLAALLLFLHFSVAHSQTIKTDVVVIGGTPGGVAAAIQCARSKVKTVLVQQSRIFMQGADTVKNLSVDTNTKFVSIKKDDDRWEIVVSTNGKTETLKSRVVVDATKDCAVVKAAGFEYLKLDLFKNSAKEYRTSIAAGSNIGVRVDTLTTNLYPPFPAYVVPVKALVVKGADNLLSIGDLLPGENTLETQLALGQAAGVTAAYCAFFKTTTANLKVRPIQVELLDFKGRLLPFSDIGADPYWRAIQQVCATGMLKGKQKMVDNKPQFLFMPDSIVTTAEVKPVLTEIYTRAFLWFNMTKPGKEFTVGNLLSFISEITLTAPDNLQNKIQKEWSQYKFKSAFDMDRPITRREFAILANKYLNPFARAVDLDGRIVN